jgi:hypothetical protein
VTTHILALHAVHAAGPGVFKVFGYKVPALLGQLFHWCAKLFKILSVALILLLMYLQGKVGLWQMAFILIIGAVAIPSWTPKISHYTTDITHGSAVGSTGASAGIVILLSAMLVVTFFLTIVKRRGDDEEVG